MNMKMLRAAVIVIGVVLVVASLFADAIGIGGHPGFGRDQAIGFVVGAIVAAVGLFLTARAK